MTTPNLDDVGIGYTLGTGRLYCDFSQLHKFVEQVLGIPVWTHELADPTLWADVRAEFEQMMTKRRIP